MMNSERRVSHAGERVQSTRKISSTILEEQYMGAKPQDWPVRQVEVPGPVQEVIRTVGRKEIIEVERRVPKYETEYVDRIVEVPRIEWVDRVVEVPQYQEVIVENRVPKIIDVPKEVVREVKIPRVNYVEQVVEVPGEIIEVPQYFNVEQVVEVVSYTERKRPVVVAQSVKPVIMEGGGAETEVDVYEYEPQCVSVDVHVAKGVQASVEAGGAVETVHRVVTVPAAQFNTMMQQMNTHLNQSELQKLPYLQEVGGRVSFLGERVVYADTPANVVIQGFDRNHLTNVYVDQSSRKALPVNDPRAGLTGYSATSPAYAPSAGGAYPSTGGYNAAAGGYSASGGYVAAGSTYQKTAASYAGGYRATTTTSPPSYASPSGNQTYTTTQQIGYTSPAQTYSSSVQQQSYHQTTQPTSSSQAGFYSSQPVYHAGVSAPQPIPVSAYSTSGPGTKYASTQPIVTSA